MTVSKTRAIAVFGKNDLGGVAWPYGAAAQPTRPQGWTEEQYAEHLADRAAAQQLAFDWAQKYGLKRSNKGCCPLWLQRDRNTRCATSRACIRYGAGTSDDRSWMDHPSTWTLDKKPAVITTAPYGIHSGDRDRLAWWMKEDPRFAVAFGGRGWYGHDTTQIVLWRTDVVSVVDPA